MANNPNVNKVVYGNTTVMDITDTTAEASDVAEGEVFYDRSGARSVGTGNYYSPSDTAETAIDDADYFPFYDTSATGKRKSTWTNIKNVLSEIFRKNIIGTYYSAGNSATYCLLCTLHVEAVRINGPTEIVIQERGRKTVARLNIVFVSSADTDPDLESFTVIGGQKNYFISKSAASTWQIYVTKNEPYSSINVLEFSPHYQRANVVGVSVVWNFENVASLPSGTVQASYEHTLADFDDDSTHRLVTDTEKSTWNGITSLGTAALKDVPVSGDAEQTEVVLGSDSRLTDAREASDVYAWAKESNKPTYDYSEIQNTPTLADVATSGSYDDLVDEPVNESALRFDHTVSLCTRHEKYKWNYAYDSAIKWFSDSVLAGATVAYITVDLQGLEQDVVAVLADDGTTKPIIIKTVEVVPASGGIPAYVEITFNALARNTDFKVGLI